MEVEEKEHHYKNKIHSPNLHLNAKCVGLEKMVGEEKMTSQALQPQPA